MLVSAVHLAGGAGREGERHILILLVEQPSEPRVGLWGILHFPFFWGFKRIICRNIFSEGLRGPAEERAPLQQSVASSDICPSDSVSVGPRRMTSELPLGGPVVPLFPLFGSRFPYQSHQPPQKGCPYHDMGGGGSEIRGTLLESLHYKGILVFGGPYVGFPDFRKPPYAVGATKAEDQASCLFFFKQAIPEDVQRFLIESLSQEWFRIQMIPIHRSFGAIISKYYQILLNII